MIYWIETCIPFYTRFRSIDVRTTSVRRPILIPSNDIAATHEASQDSNADATLKAARDIVLLIFSSVTT